MKKLTRRLFIFGGLAALAGTGCYSWRLWRQFGALSAQGFNSPYWQSGVFHNLPGGQLYEGLDNEPLHSGGWLKFFLERGGERYPPKPVQTRKADLHSLADGEFVWLGHSSCILRLGGKIICIDPVLADRASPVPFTIPAWPGASPYEANDFPKIDYLCISHDHWDHLDYKAVNSLKYDQAICGLGVGAHFKAWGLRKPLELDWHGELRDGGLRLVFTPSQHFSGRGTSRNHSLWGGFAISAGSGGSAYFTGDGGYGRHFAALGKQYGPFDMVFPDSGQYNRAWPTVHMFPEQAVQAGRDARGKLLCPVHRGKFTLAWHAWNEPERRFSARARKMGVKFILPAIGEKCSLAQMADAL